MDAGRKRDGEPRIRGGVAGAAEVRQVAFAEVYSPGLGIAMLRSPDPALVGVLQAVAVEAAELQRKRDERLARMTANYTARNLR